MTFICSLRALTLPAFRRLSKGVGATCELQQLTQAAAEEYLRQPALLVEVRRAEHDKWSQEWHPDFDFIRWNEVRKTRSYDWIVLVKGLVSFSRIAHSLIVHGGEPIGGLEESWLMGGNAKVLSSEQVVTLHHSLASTSLSQADEHFDGHALMFKDFQRFLEEAANANKALLFFVGP